MWPTFASKRHLAFQGDLAWAALLKLPLAIVSKY